MMRLTTIKNRQQGFTLIELMVAMVLSLILLLGITQIFSSTNASYHLQEGLSRMQENARFAINFLRKDFRQAGYVGCADDTPLVNTLNNATSTSWDYGRTVQGFQSTGAGSWSATLPTGIVPADGTDAILIRYATSAGMFINQGMPPNAAVLQIAAVVPSPIQTGDILTVTDCSFTSIFQVTGNPSGGTLTAVNHNAGGATTPGNATVNLGQAYGAGSEILIMNSIVYYVAENTDGTRSLYRRVQGSDALELVRGVENMQLQYGIDTSNDGSVDSYVTADAVTNWSNVISIRTALLINSIDRALDKKDTQTYTLLDATVDPEDTKQLRHTFVTTATLRNRVLVAGGPGTNQF